MSEDTFKVGDRVKVNDTYPRSRLVGAQGVVSETVDVLPDCMYFKADDPELVGSAKNGSWAVLDSELDKLES